MNSWIDHHELLRVLACEDPIVLACEDPIGRCSVAYMRCWIPLIPFDDGYVEACLDIRMNRGRACILSCNLWGETVWQTAVSNWAAELALSQCVRKNLLSLRSSALASLCCPHYMHPSSTHTHAHTPMSVRQHKGAQWDRRSRIPNCRPPVRMVGAHKDSGFNNTDSTACRHVKTPFLPVCGLVLLFNTSSLIMQTLRFVRCSHMASLATIANLRVLSASTGLRGPFIKEMPIARCRTHIGAAAFRSCSTASPAPLRMESVRLMPDGNVMLEKGTKWIVCYVLVCVSWCESGCH